MWAPISPQWLKDTSGCFFVAFAKSQDSFKCFEVNLPSIEPTMRLLPQTQVEDIRSLEQEFERVKEETSIGESLNMDLNLIILKWMMHLKDPSYHDILPSKIKQIADISTSQSDNFEQLVHNINDVSLLLNHRFVLRSSSCGEICKSAGAVIDTVNTRAKKENEILQNSNSLEMVQNYVFGLEFRNRLQNQDWRLVVYLRDPNERVTQSRIYNFGPQDDGYTTVCFSHVFSENLYLVVEISAGTVDGPYSRIACGVLKLPAPIETQINLVAPFGGHWSNFVQKLIGGVEGDKCALIPSLTISQGPLTAPALTPSFINDGFQYYRALHLQTHGFLADTHQSSAYFLRFRPQGSYFIDQTSSSFFHHNQTNEECFTFTNFERGDSIRVELWRGKTLVSIANAECDKSAFTIHFHSLTTFQSVGITKHLAALQCTATFMGQQNMPDSLVRIGDYRNYTEVQILAQLKALEIDPAMIRYFESLGTSLLEVITFFDCPEVSEAAFIKLLLLLDCTKLFPYSMKGLLESKKLSSFQSGTDLGIFLKQLFNLFASKDRSMFLIEHCSKIKELILYISGIQPLQNCHDDQGTLFSDCDELVLPRKTKSGTSPSIKSASSDGLSGSESKRNDFNWRNRALVEQIKDIVAEMAAAYTRCADNLKLRYLDALNSYFDVFKMLIGDSTVVLWMKFMAVVEWIPEYFDVNSRKLELLAQAHSRWSFKENTSLRFANLCLNSIAPVWLNRSSQPQRIWQGVHAIACILHNLREILSADEAKEIVPKILPLLFNITGSMVGSRSSCSFGQNTSLERLFDCTDFGVRDQTTSLELVLLVREFLELASGLSIRLSSPADRQIMQGIALKAINSCHEWIRFDLFDVGMYSMQLVQASTISSTLKYVAGILMQYFLPLPDEGATFETDLWYHLFHLLGTISLWADKVVPLDPFEECAYKNLAGPLKEETISLIGECWHALQWVPSGPGDCSFLYGYQVSLFCCENNVTSLFVELIFAGNKSVEPLLRNIVDTEWIISESLQEICLEVLDAVDNTFIDLYRSGAALPSPDQCNGFISIFEDHCEPNYQNFIETIKNYMDLISDNYRFNSLLTVQRIINFLKEKRAHSLLYKYLGLILQSEKNPRYIGLALVELANIYQWDNNCKLDSLVCPALPPQRAHQRRESLMRMATQHFIDSGSWLLAIETIQDCEIYYNKVLDYYNLAMASGQLTQLYQRVAIERNVAPNYYLVEFGQGFWGLSGESYIFEQPPYVRLDEFTKSIHEKYTSVTIGTGTGISIKTVEPKPYDMVEESTVMPWLGNVLKSHRVCQFVSSTPLPHQGVLDMRVEIVTFEVETSFPAVCCHSRVLKTTKTQLNSMENAIQVIQLRSQELRILCCRHSMYPQESKISIHLEMLLGSTLSSPINGGLSQYRELLTRDHTKKLSKAFQELKQAARLALELYYQILDEAMLPQYEHFMQLYADNF